MSDMELIVRPFQSPNTINDKKQITILPKVGKTNEIVLEWGNPGADPTILSLAINVNDKNFNEVANSRKTQDVRVENPDDSNQYIMEKRTDEIGFKVEDKYANPLAEANAANEQKAAKERNDTELQRQQDAFVKQGMDQSSAHDLVYGTPDQQAAKEKKKQDDASYKANYHLLPPDQQP